MSTWQQATERAVQRVPDLTRCEPAPGACQQAERCAMTSSDRRGTVVDGSVAVAALGHCPMFTDGRRQRWAADPRFAAWAARSPC